MSFVEKKGIMMDTFKIQTEFNCDQQYIENRAAEILASNISKRFEAKMWDSYFKKVNLTIDQTINQFLDEFMDRNIIETDKYGDEVNRHENVKELLKTKFDEFMTEEVDSKGAPTKGCAYNRQIRAEYLIETEVVSHLKKYHSDVEREGKAIAEGILREIKNEKYEDAKNEVLKRLVDDVKL